MPRETAPVSLQQASPFIEAHLRGNVEAVRRLLTELPALERFPPRSGTWLHESAAAGSVALVEFWLGRGYDVNLNQPGLDAARDGMFTPLHSAKNADVASLLISKGAAVNAWERRTGTPLHRAALMKDMKLIRALLDAGADTAIADENGLTPLAVAIKYKQHEAEKLLRSAGAPLEGRMLSGRAVRKPPVIDLRQDLRQIEQTIVQAVEQFATDHPDEPVTAIALAASGIEGYVSVGIDTGEFQGSPWDVSYHEYAAANFPDWQQAYELAGQAVHITTVDGSQFDYGGARRGDAVFQEPFYAACLAALRALEHSAALARLNRAAGFTLGIEISSGDHAQFWQPQL
jgi:hypothetical protein